MTSSIDTSFVYQYTFDDRLKPTKTSSAIRDTFLVRSDSWCTYQYDDKGRVEKVFVYNSDSPSNPVKTATVIHDPVSGLWKSITWPNWGTFEITARDGDGNITHRRFTSPNGLLVVDTDYKWENGNRVKYTQEKPSTGFLDEVVYTYDLTKKNTILFDVNQIVTDGLPRSNNKNLLMKEEFFTSYGASRTLVYTMNSTYEFDDQGRVTKRTDTYHRPSYPTIYNYTFYSYQCK